MPDQPNPLPAANAALPAPTRPLAAPAGFVNVEIDGRPLQVRAGTNLIEAANQLDVQIPFYCYHKRLTIAANCRMCLVKVSNAPKLVPACQTPVVEGLRVTTNSPEVRESHRSVQEFLLYNHPVDCAICDQAGECKLQDYYMQYDHRPYRPTAPKLLRHKRKEIGPLVMLDQERCILCTRCVRFMKEIPKAPQLGVFGRGHLEYIDVFPGETLDSKYAGNTVDICPVGALLSRDFRFKARAFYLTQTPSICAGCSRGCNAFLDTFDRVAYRYRPRENDAVNASWMCDDGRLTYHRLNEDRTLSASSGRAGTTQPAPLGEALREVARRLGERSGKPALGILLSPQLSVEDLLGVCLLAKEGLGATTLFEGGLPDGDQDDLLIRPDKNPDRMGLTWVARAFGLEVQPFQALLDQVEEGTIEALYAAGTEVPAEPSIVAAVLEPLAFLAVQTFGPSPVTLAADVVLPAAPHSETDGCFVNFQGHVQRFQEAYPPTGDARPHWWLALEILRHLGFAAPKFTTARELFLALAPRVPELTTVDWGDLGPSVVERPGLASSPTAADARPPGYRERVVSPPWIKKVGS